MTFDLATPHGRMMATMLAGIAEFERELIQERIRSGIAAAKARGKRLGRQPGQRPKSDRLAPKVLALVDKGTQLSLDRARGGAEQEYRRRYRQTSPRSRRLRSPDCYFASGDTNVGSGPSTGQFRPPLADPLSRPGAAGDHALGAPGGSERFACPGPRVWWMSNPSSRR